MNKILGAIFAPLVADRLLIQSYSTASRLLVSCCCSSVSATAVVAAPLLRPASPAPSPLTRTQHTSIQPLLPFFLLPDQTFFSDQSPSCNTRRAQRERQQRNARDVRLFLLMASGPCARILTALQDCKRKHPRDPVRTLWEAGARSVRRDRGGWCRCRRRCCRRHWPPPSHHRSISHQTSPSQTKQQFICQHLTASAGWCMWSNLCPKEVRNIEDCLGVASSSGAAPRIPPRCAHRAAELEACIAAHQQLADERTDRCTGPQPIGGPARAPSSSSPAGSK